MHLAVTAIACATVLLGACTQRLTGLGFALVAAPLLVAILGPTDGVLLGNVLSAVLCAVVLISAWHQVRWRRVLIMVLPALITVPLGAWVVRRVPAAPLTVLVGAIALAAVLVTTFARRFRLLPGRPGAVIGGALAGFMNVTAGVGGPPLAIHGVSERWPREIFVGTGQAFLLVINCLSIASKGVPRVPVSLWVGSGCALLAGALIGNLISRRVSERVGRVLVLTLAAVGSAAALLRGLTGL